MSQANVEIVRRYFEQAQPATINPGVIAEFWEEDSDYYPVRKFPEARPCHGREEIGAFLAAFSDAWQIARFRLIDISPVGDDRVLVRAHLETKGRVSGLALEGDLYYCLWLRHGRCFRQEDHLTQEGARRALGLLDE